MLGLPLSQNEFNATADLVFNVGITKLGLKGSPNLNQAFAEGNYKNIHDNLIYTKADGQVLPGLVIRSMRRQLLFSGGDWRGYR